MRFKISLKTTASAFVLITILASFTALQAMKEGDETPEASSKTTTCKPENEENNVATKLFNLAVQYHQGHGVSRNVKKAAMLYQLASDEGNPAAQNNLGAMYLDGRGTEKDKKIAASFYQLAADQGVATAQTNLAGMYLDGIGVEKNETKALAYLKLAADQGYSRAISVLESIGVSPTKDTLELH